MKPETSRRDFVKSLMIVPALSSVTTENKDEKSLSLEDKSKRSKLKTSLNAYSFNAPLTDKSMNLDDLLDFCADQNFDGVDLTGYYFPNYPQVPSDEYIYHIKRKAHLLGLEITGTGIRNDYTNPDPGKRKADVQMIKQWIEVAAKLGAPVIRVFSGVIRPKEYTWNQIATWMVKDIRECVEYGQKHGVIVAIQNHNDFIQTADDVIKIMKMVNMEWFGLILDIGSYHQGDPYTQIAQTVQYAVNWQVKENIFVDGVEVKTDLKRLFKIVKESGYRGSLPIETLGKGDSKEKVSKFLKEVQQALKEV